MAFLALQARQGVLLPLVLDSPPLVASRQDASDRSFALDQQSRESGDENITKFLL